MTGLYIIIDPDHCGGRDPVELARTVLEVSPHCVQLRWKTRSDQDFLDAARSISTLCRDRGVPFVVNDRPDIAVLAEAHGVHLGQSDLPVAAARRIVGRRSIGVSTHNLDQARRAIADGADLIGFGPIFFTHSKTNPDPEVGIEMLARVCEQSSVPVIAIGGITTATIPTIARAGAAFAAVVSAVGHANDPTRAAQDLLAATRGEACSSNLQ